MIDFIKKKYNNLYFRKKIKLSNEEVNHFSIIIDCCNQEKWIKKCIKSCLNQEYNNFEVILLDAISDDRTYEIAKSFSLTDSRLKIFQNEQRLPQIANILNLTKISKPGSIIVSVDGDDWLPHEQILLKLNKIYSPDVWMTYGTYIEYHGFFQKYRSVSHIYSSYPHEVIKHNAFRNYRWLGSHLRTYRRELFLKIDENDFKREDGEWLDTAGDRAFMIPMLEMSGNKSRYISEIMYVYNMANAKRDGYVNLSRQDVLADYIARKKKYHLIDSL